MRASELWYPLLGTALCASAAAPALTVSLEGALQVDGLRVLGHLLLALSCSARGRCLVSAEPSKSRSEEGSPCFTALPSPPFCFFFCWPPLSILCNKS